MKQPLLNISAKILLVCTLATNLIAVEKIKFQYATHNITRVYPAQTQNILSYNNILEDIKNTVANISTQKSLNSNGVYANPFLSDPFFREFFRDYNNGKIPRQRLQRALGSGVIISKDGYIVTNNHVVDGADTITVTLAGDKKEYEAKLIGKDAKSDIAIIKINKDNLNAITFCNSDDVKIGDIVFAIGNPFGVGETITHGIVSATGRSSVGIVEYENFIQTDAPINPGNSGGALINSAGNLIGINSAIISKGGGNVGIGFAIPSNMVTSIASQLINKGKITRAYLGVAIMDISEDMSKFYNNKFGALITSLEDDTPAQDAGLKRGDLIISIDDKEITSANELKNTIGFYTPDKTIKIEFLREKKIYTVNVKLTSSDNLLGNNGSIEYKGLALEELNTKNKHAFKIMANINGVLVSDVKENTDAQNIGILKGDIIIQVENNEIKNLDDFKKTVNSNIKKRIYIYRSGVIIATVL